MSDLDLFNAIVRATRDVPMDRIGQAVATVRALFASEVPVERIERAARGNRDRMDRSGSNRAE